MSDGFFYRSDGEMDYDPRLDRREFVVRDSNGMPQSGHATLQSGIEMVDGLMKTSPERGWRVDRDHGGSNCTRRERGLYDPSGQTVGPTRHAVGRLRQWVQRAFGWNEGQV